LPGNLALSILSNKVIPGEGNNSEAAELAVLNIKPSEGAYLTEEQVLSLLRHYGKLGEEVGMTDHATISLVAHFRVDLAILPGDVKRAAASILREVLIYGKPEREKWTKDETGHLVTLSYLNFAWKIHMDQGCTPTLREIAEIS